jgi:hypothetical protein
MFHWGEWLSKSRFGLLQLTRQVGEGCFAADKARRGHCGEGLGGGTGAEAGAQDGSRAEEGRGHAGRSSVCVCVCVCVRL